MEVKKLLWEEAHVLAIARCQMHVLYRGKRSARDILEVGWDRWALLLCQRLLGTIVLLVPIPEVGRICQACAETEAWHKSRGKSRVCGTCV